MVDEEKIERSLKRSILDYLEEEDVTDDEDELSDLLEQLSAKCIDDYTDLLDFYEGCDEEEYEDDLRDLIDAAYEGIKDSEEDEIKSRDDEPIFIAAVNAIFGTNGKRSNKKTTDHEEYFYSEHGNEEDFLEEYGEDFDDDEEAADAFYDEMEDDDK